MPHHEPLGFKPHLYKQADGRGGHTLHTCDYQFLHTPGEGGQYTMAFGLAKMDNGEVVFLGSWRDAECERPVIAFSTDQGDTWTQRKLIEGIRPPRGELARPLGLAYLGGGKLTFQCAEPAFMRCVSDDYGRTWTSAGQSQLADNGGGWGYEGNPLVEYGDDGMAVRMAEIGWNYQGSTLDNVIPGWPVAPANGMIRWSHDGGLTWAQEQAPKAWLFDDEKDGRTITRGISEGSLVRAANGDLVAALRTDMPARYLTDDLTGTVADDRVEGTGISISGDDGKTWSPVQILFDAGRHHAHLLRLPNDDLLMTITVRNDIHDGKLVSYRRGRDAVISRDHGRTWDLGHRYELDAYELYDGVAWQNGECGHLYQTLLDDGRVLTAHTHYLTKGACLLRWQP